MVGECIDCRYHRHGTSTAKQLIELTPRYGYPDVLKTFTELRHRDEEQVQLNESYLDLDEQRLPLRLDFRPTAFQYCGENEIAGISEDLRIKNADLSCESFRPRDSGLRDCASCAHRQAAPVELVARLQTIHIDASEPADSTSERILALWERISSNIKQRVSVELQELYQHQGVLDKRPLHFPWCAAVSDTSSGTYVVGEIRNAGNTCKKWTPANEVHEILEDEWETLKRMRNEARAGLGAPPADTAAYAELIRWQGSSRAVELKDAYNRAATQYVVSALQRLGASRDESYDAGVQLYAALSRRDGRPAGAGVTVVSARNGGPKMPNRPEPEEKSQPEPRTSSSRKRETLFKLLGLAVDAIAEHARSRQTPSRESGVIRRPSGSQSTENAPTAAGRKDFENADDAVALDRAGTYKHPSVVGCVIDVLSRSPQVVEASFTLRAPTGSVIETSQMKFALESDTRALVSSQLGLLWYNVANLACDVWHPATAITGIRRFPLMIRFSSRPAGRGQQMIDVNVLWLSRAL